MRFFGPAAAGADPGGRAVAAFEDIGACACADAAPNARHAVSISNTATETRPVLITLAPCALLSRLTLDADVARRLNPELPGSDHAKALGFTILQSPLLHADEVIQ